MSIDEQKWRDDSPDWQDCGTIELLRADGTTITGKLKVEDVWFTGEEEIPIFVVEFGSHDTRSFWDFEQTDRPWWRVIKS